jgi:hypothetical protein
MQILRIRRAFFSFGSLWMAMMLGGWRGLWLGTGFELARQAGGWSGVWKGVKTPTDTLQSGLRPTKWMCGYVRGREYMCESVCAVFWPCLPDLGR